LKFPATTTVLLDTQNKYSMDEEEKQEEEEKQVEIEKQEEEEMQ
jgi:hypothetical protein